MGLLQDLYKNPVVKNMTRASGTGLGILDQLGGSASGPEDPRAPHTFIPTGAKNEQAQGLANRLYNTEAARGYGGVFDQGYQNLSQPLHDTNRDDVYVGGTRALASTFADKVLQKTGKLPTEEQVRNFVAENLTPSFAQKFIVGMPPEQISQLVDQHLQYNPDVVTSLQPQPQEMAPSGPVPAVQSLQDLNTRLPGLYDNLRTNLQNYTDTAFAAPRKAAIEDEAVLGRLRSPASIPNIANVDIAKANALQSGLSNIGIQQLSGETDLAKALSNVQQEQERIRNQSTQFGQSLGQQNRQFNQTAGLQNRQLNMQGDILNQNIALQNRQLGLADELGRRQADAGKNNGLAGAFGGAAGGAQAGSAFGPWGAAAGGIGGGLLGYFGTKR